MIMMLRTILTIVGFLCLPGGVLSLVYGITKKRKGFRILGVVGMLLCPLLMCLQFMIAVKQYSFDLASVPTFNVTSTSLSSGVWDDSISNTRVGSNTSPELSWEEVPGAEVYLVYMIDPDGFEWIHMKTTTTSTSLPAGSVSDFVGPYPPSGTHNYIVYVFALRSEKDHYAGSLDTISSGINFLGQQANQYMNGDPGNVIAYGTVSGTFSHVE